MTPANAEPGRLVVAATPIGNAGDASVRLVEALATADLIAAEDTRRVRELARRLGVAITAPVVSLYDHNEAGEAHRLVQRVAEGARVVLVSDAGTPAVSDPGYRVIRAAVDGGVTVETLPGPSAAIAALVLSGLPTDRFCFEGFPPRASAERDRAFAALADERRTMVFFEAARRAEQTLLAMGRAFGADRRASCSREITKTHEETRRGTLGELASWAADGLRGELVIVVAGAQATAPDAVALADEVLARAAAGERLKDAARAVSDATGASARELYAAALSRKPER